MGLVLPAPLTPQGSSRARRWAGLAGQGVLGRWGWGEICSVLVPLAMGIGLLLWALGGRPDGTRSSPSRAFAQSFAQRCF